MKNTLKSKAVLLLTAAVIIEGLLIGAGFAKLSNFEENEDATSSSQSSAGKDSMAVSMKSLEALSFSQPVVSVSENKVYLPELKLALPLNDTTSSLLFMGRLTGNPDKQQTKTYDVSTRSLASLSPVGYQQEKACYPVRLAFEEKANPFSPHESDNQSVELADGRTLQIYSNDESLCSAQWEAANVDPTKIKQAIEQANSY